MHGVDEGNPGHHVVIYLANSRRFGHEREVAGHIPPHGLVKLIDHHAPTRTIGLADEYPIINKIKSHGTIGIAAHLRDAAYIRGEVWLSQFVAGVHAVDDLV